MQFVALWCTIKKKLPELIWELWAYKHAHTYHTAIVAQFLQKEINQNVLQLIYKVNYYYHLWPYKPVTVQMAQKKSKMWGEKTKTQIIWTL